MKLSDVLFPTRGVLLAFLLALCALTVFAPSPIKADEAQRVQKWRQLRDFFGLARIPYGTAQQARAALRNGDADLGDAQAETRAASSRARVTPSGAISETALEFGGAARITR